MPETRDLQAARSSLGDVSSSIQDERDAFYRAYSFDVPEADDTVSHSSDAGKLDEGPGVAEPGGSVDPGEVHVSDEADVQLTVSNPETASIFSQRSELSELLKLSGGWDGKFGSLDDSIDASDVSSVAAPASTTGSAAAPRLDMYRLGADLGQSISAPGSPLSQADIIRIGMAMARASYGESAISGSFRGTWQGKDDQLGYDDDYRHYVASWTNGSEKWALIGPGILGSNLGGGSNWTAGGLYRSGVGWFGDPDDENQGEALVALRDVGGEKTLVLSFRGSDGSDALWEGQTFTSIGLHHYYEGLRPLIRAVAAYVSANGIENVIVSGHSLGGTLVDYFARASAGLFAGTNLSLVSVASAGLPPADAALPVSAAVDDYIGIAHSQDRVHHPNLQEFGWELTPTTPLLDNVASETSFLINLPNLGNSEANYPDYASVADILYDPLRLLFFSHGFGAEHNGELYWANVDALTRDILFDLYNGQSITMGLTDYSRVADVNGTFAMFQSYTGLVNSYYFDDNGTRQLIGAGGAPGSYVLRLDGNDSILGRSSGDLLSGGDGNDTLYGGGGRDWLAGGDGGDILRGGTGADTFVYGLDDLGWVYRDIIADYNQGGGTYNAGEGDVIDISAIVGAAYAAGQTASSLWKVARDQFTGEVHFYVDRDGTGIDYAWDLLATFTGMAPGGVIDVDLGEGPGGGTDDDVVPGRPGSWTITSPAAQVDEDAGTVTFTITRPDDRAEETVYISTTTNRGSSNNNDYVYWLNVPHTFAAGVSTWTFTIDINDNSTREGPETFGIIVQSSASQEPSQYLASSSFTIMDDDASGFSGSFTSSSNRVWITPPTGASVYDGLGGNDTLTLDLRDWVGISTWNSGNPLTFGTGANTVTFHNVESFNVLGGSGNDYLTGATGSDLLFGGSGDDVLTGAGGLDALDGGDGNDTFNLGSDVDFVAGGAGLDLVVFDFSAETRDLLINLGTSEAAGRTWTGIERISGLLGSGDDTVIGSIPGNLDAGEGVDLLVLDFRNSLPDGRVAVSAEFYTTIYVTFDDGSVEYGDAFGFDRFIFHGTSGQDFFLGGNRSDSLYGGEGDDRFDLGLGEDRAYGGDGNDYFYTGTAAGSDVIDGGVGWDTVEFGFANETQDILIDVQSRRFGHLSWAEIEDAFGALGSGNDSLRCSVPYFAGGREYYGGAGLDYVNIDFSEWDHTSFAATAIEVFVISDYTGVPYTIVTWDGWTQTPFGGRGQAISIRGFESMELHGFEGNDLLRGLSGSDTLHGMSGNDTLVADSGGDFLYGEDGNDLFKSWGADDNTYFGGNGDDHFGEYALDEGDTIYGGSGFDEMWISLGDDAVSVDARNGSGSHSLWSSIENIELWLNGGDDTLLGAELYGQGYSVFSGGDGNDTVVLDFSKPDVKQASVARIECINTGDVVYDFDVLRTHFADGSYVQSRFGFETVILTGSEGDDVLIGGILRSTLKGGAGSDVVNGLDGTDQLFGGIGADSLLGAAGNDLISGGQGSDYTFGGAGNDTLSGGVGRDAFVFNIAPSAGNVDTITDFSAVDDTIRLDDAVFAGLAVGTLAASAFAANLTGQATGAAKRILYETDTGKLFFDADGVGGAARVQFATISVGLTLTSADFVVF